MTSVLPHSRSSQDLSLCHNFPNKVIIISLGIDSQKFSHKITWWWTFLNSKASWWKRKYADHCIVSLHIRFWANNVLALQRIKNTYWKQGKCLEKWSQGPVLFYDYQRKMAKENFFHSTRPKTSRNCMQENMLYNIWPCMRAWGNILFSSHMNFFTQDEEKPNTGLSSTTIVIALFLDIGNKFSHARSHHNLADLWKVHRYPNSLQAPMPKRVRHSITHVCTSSDK